MMVSLPESTDNDYMLNDPDFIKKKINLLIDSEINQKVM